MIDRGLHSSELFYYYIKMVKPIYKFYWFHEMSKEFTDNIVRKFRYTGERNNIVGYYDVSSSDGEMVGFLFATDRMVYKENDGKKCQNIKYDELEDIKLNFDDNIIFEFKNGEKIEWKIFYFDNREFYTLIKSIIGIKEGCALSATSTVNLNFLGSRAHEGFKLK